MRPQRWQPPVALSGEETAIVRRIHRAKLFVFLREQRHHLFTPDFQDELARELYADKPKGHPPIPPAQLALATLLQAYTGVSDNEVIEATTMDRRWQLVLDCLDCTQPPFSKATLIAFRQRLIAHEGDRRLVERTLEVAQASGLFSPKALRVALDSSPLCGAGKVEDTFNLLGHALRIAGARSVHHLCATLPVCYTAASRRPRTATASVEGRSMAMGSIGNSPNPVGMQGWEYQAQYRLNPHGQPRPSTPPPSERPTLRQRLRQLWLRLRARWSPVWKHRDGAAGEM